MVTEPVNELNVVPDLMSDPLLGTDNLAEAAIVIWSVCVVVAVAQKHQLDASMAKAIMKSSVRPRILVPNLCRIVSAIPY